MMRTTTAISLALAWVLLLPIGVQAQSAEQSAYSDRQLFDAYMAGDMQLWKEYIDHAGFDTLPAQEQERRLYYEYGYAASLIDTDKRAAKPYIRQFGAHIEQLKDRLPAVLVHVYSAAYQTYDLAVTPLRVARHSQLIFHHAQQAVITDARHPLAWGIQANVHFYAPRMMGGNKQLAMQEYERADSLFAATAAQRALDWTYVAQTLSLVQCYDKLGKTQLALQKARQALARWPQYDYLRQYVLQLEERNKK